MLLMTLRGGVCRQFQKPAGFRLSFENNQTISDCHAVLAGGFARFHVSALVFPDRPDAAWLDAVSSSALSSFVNEIATNAQTCKKCPRWKMAN
jgi:hypothetical protein